MKFLDLFFGKARTAETAPTPTFVDERLFVSHDEPIVEEVQQKRNIRSLDEILHRNFEKEGFRDGYELHRIDHLTNRIDSTVAEFRLVFRSKIEEVEADIAELQPFLMDSVKEYMPEQYIRIQTRHDYLKLDKAALEAELELAVKKEGFIEKAICDYRMGFEKGFALFTDERLLTNRFMNH